MPSDAEFPKVLYVLLVEPSLLQAAFGGSGWALRGFVLAENNLLSLAADCELWEGRGNS